MLYASFASLSIHGKDLLDSIFTLPTFNEVLVECVTNARPKDRFRFFMWSHMYMARGHSDAISEANQPSVSPLCTAK